MHPKQLRFPTWLVPLTDVFIALSSAALAHDPDAHWVPFGDYTENGFSIQASELAAHDGQLIAAGDFFYLWRGPDLLDREIAGCIARWDGTRWQTLGVGVEYEWPWIPGFRPWINDVVTFRDDLLVGGRFHLAGGRTSEFRADNVARWDGAAWHRLGAGVDDDVYALAVYNNELIVGGNFTQAGGNPIPSIARWDGSGWRRVGDGLDRGPLHFIEFQGNLIAAGDFSQSGSTPLNGIARWDGTQWSAIAPESMSYGNSDLCIYENTLVVSMYWDPSVPHLSRWDGETWSLLETGDVGSAFALAPYNGRLIAGGNMRPSSWPYSNIAQAKDGRWQAMGSGVDNDVLEMLVHEGSLYVVGRFLEAGGRPSNFIARWDDVITPVALQDLIATSEPGGVRLQWRLAGSARDELLGVRVQRADDYTRSYRTLTQTPLSPEIEMSFFDADVEVGTRLAYRLLLASRDGSSQIAGPIYVSVTSGGHRTSLRAPRDSGAGEPLPIRYSIGPSRSEVRLDVYDVRGRLVRQLEHGAATPGEHHRYWDRSTAGGSRATRGVYIVRLDSGGTVLAKKLVLLHE